MLWTQLLPPESNLPQNTLRRNDQSLKLKNEVQHHQSAPRSRVETACDEDDSAHHRELLDWASKKERKSNSVNGATIGGRPVAYVVVCSETHI
jgi:hypothetical protein